jgi:Holliday junction resolvase RusA-like endonuclease
MSKEKKIIYPISFEEPNKEVKIIVPGKPFGKQRPRMMRRGKFTTTYTPKETVEYENLVKLSYYNSVGDTKLKGAIKAEIKGVFPIPKSATKKELYEIKSGNNKYTKKIDCDNMAKCVLDALNNIAYDDDSQIYSLSVTKEYGEVPRVEIILKEDNF